MLVICEFTFFFFVFLFWCLDILFQVGEHWYLISNDQLAWPQAQYSCMNMKGKEKQCVSWLDVFDCIGYRNDSGPLGSICYGEWCTMVFGGLHSVISKILGFKHGTWFLLLTQLPPREIGTEGIKVERRHAAEAVTPREKNMEKLNRQTFFMIDNKVGTIRS